MTAGLKHITALILAAFLVYSWPAAASDDKPNDKIPRFASLRSGDVNMRVGPGLRYSINWVYKHEGLPVEIIQTFEEWRKIRDSEGTTGWVHKQMLQGKRTAIIRKNIVVLRHAPDDHSSAVVKAEPGVTGKITECEIEWCKIQIAGHKGWVRKANIWGVYMDEKF